MEKFGGPKLITASLPGKGAGATKGQVAFDALRENPRAALTVVNSTVYPGLGAIAYFNGHAFFATSDDFLRDYAIKSGRLTLYATSSAKFVDPGATPSISTATGMQSFGPSPPKPGTAPIPNTPSSTPSTQPSWASRSTSPNKTANATARPWPPASSSRS